MANIHFFVYVVYVTLVVGSTVSGLYLINAYSDLLYQLIGVGILVLSDLGCYLALRHTIKEALDDEAVLRETQSTGVSSTVAAQVNSLTGRLMFRYPMEFVMNWILLQLSLILIPRVHVEIDVVIGSSLMVLIFLFGMVWAFVTGKEDRKNISRITELHFGFKK